MAQNRDEAQTIAQQAKTTIEASEDGRTYDGHESDSSSSASTSLSSSVRDYTLKMGAGIIIFGRGNISGRMVNHSKLKNNMKHAMVANLLW